MDPKPEPPYSYPRKFSRRNFLQTSAVLAGGMSLYPLMSQGGSSGFIPNAGATHWYAKPLLILQTVLRETDARHYGVWTHPAYPAPDTGPCYRGHTETEERSLANYEVLRAQGRCQVISRGQWW